MHTGALILTDNENAILIYRFTNYQTISYRIDMYTTDLYTYIFLNDDNTITLNLKQGNSHGEIIEDKYIYDLNFTEFTIRLQNLFKNYNTNIENELLTNIQKDLNNC